ncbi:MAG: sugar phosphate isomerase/epimerase [Lactobacillus sp.]|jgi:sugar phosphate isomerase/epimerase|nr:sugar phosphate isomerase/epimerase [Lactobacillus sp.]MCI2033722.1 sugar phosphate isomerase/epimerase [Lactobacillus sp.]
MTLILNTWIFEADVKAGVSQADLVERVAKLGADGIEVRREYFTDLDQEPPEVAKRAQATNMIVNLSVPDVVFTDDGQLNPKLAQYFAEGQQLGVKKIKFNTGHFDRFDGDLKQAFSQFPLAEIEMNVENDQTAVSGTIDAIENFLTAAHAAGLTSLGYVYDLGNWAFTHGDAEAAATRLAPFTHYIHLKNTIDDHGTLVTSDDLDTGIYDWRSLIKQLPQDQYYALEYPMATDAQIAAQIKLFQDR